MKSKEELKHNILELMTVLPIIETNQAASLLTGERESPQKRVSELLMELEKEERLVESRHREKYKTKLYRLTKIGREQMGVPKKRRVVPWNHRNLDHFLTLGNLMIFLKQNGKLHEFEVEPQYPYTDAKGKEKVYPPDVFYIFNKKPYLLECQLSPMSSRKWANKHRIRNEYFAGGHYLRAPFQQRYKKPVTPPLVIWSRRQMEHTITSGSEGSVFVVRDLPDFLKL